MILREKFNKLKEQNDDKKLMIFHQKHQHLFVMPAKILTDEIVKVLKAKDETLKVNPVHEVVGDYHNMQQREDKTSVFNETISTSIAIKKANKIEKIILIENSTAVSEDSFRFGTYNVDIFNLLLNDNIPHKDEIHQACWSAIAKNLKNHLAEQNLTK
ncbi:MAG: hypothetical protein IJ415_02580 [Clostridia bacterium]|nr:hypothetical protein [Clostridia bacterium]